MKSIAAKAFAVGLLAASGTASSIRSQNYLRGQTGVSGHLKSTVGEQDKPWIVVSDNYGVLNSIESSVAKNALKNETAKANLKKLMLMDAGKLPETQVDTEDASGATGAAEQEGKSGNEEAVDSESGIEEEVDSKKVVPSTREEGAPEDEVEEVDSDESSTGTNEKETGDLVREVSEPTEEASKSGCC